MRVLEEERQVVDTLCLEPVLAVVGSTVHDIVDVVLLQDLVVLGNLLPRHKQSLQNLRALVFEVLHFELVASSRSNIEVDLPVQGLLFDLFVLGLLERL